MDDHIEFAAQDALRVLHLEANLSDSELIRARIEAEWPGAKFLRVDTQDAFVHALEAFRPNLVIADCKVRGFDGKAALKVVRAGYPEIPVLMVTGHLSELEAVSLIKHGAKDYLLKDNLARLNTSIRQVLSWEQGIRERKAAEHALEKNEHELRILIEYSPVAIVVVGNDGRFRLVNRRFSELFGYSLSDVPDIEAWWLHAYPDAEYREAIKAEWIRRSGLAIDSQSSIEPMEARVTCKNGMQRYVRGSLTAMGEHSIVTLEDLSAIRQSEAKLQRLSNLYAVLSQCNEHIMRCNDEMELFALVCRDVVEIGGFKMAWVGLVDDDSRMVQLVTRFGEGTEYLNGILISADEDSPHGQGPSGRAIREQRPVWCQDFQHDPMTEPWRERGKQFGWHSSAALPLLLGGRVAGILTLYGTEIGAFDEGSRNLLQEMAANISFALDRFASEALRNRQQEELLATRTALQATLDAIPDLMFEVDILGRYLNVHEPRTGLLLAPAEQLIGRYISDFLPPEATEVCFAALLEAYTQGWSIGKQYRLPGADGEQWYELSVAKRFAEAGEPSRFVVLARDITERKRGEASLVKLQQAVEQSPNTIVITDLDANIEYANPAFGRTTGYALEEAVGKNPRMLQSGKTSRETYAEMWANLTAGKVWRGEFVNRHKDGGEYVEAVQISPVRQPDGRITNYLAIKEDITANKRMQEKILRDSRRMAALLKINEVVGTMPEQELLEFGLGFAEQLTGSKISFLHFVNEAQESIELVAWSAATVDRYCTADYDKHYPISQAGIWADCFRRKTPVIVNDYPGYPAKHGLPAGHAPLQRMLSVPVIEEGKVWIILGVGNKDEDYTDEDIEAVQLIGNDLWRIVRRMRAEAALAQSLDEQIELNARLATARMQLLQSEKMASVGVLAAGVAHEINNPVGYVNSNLGTLEKYLADIFLIMSRHEELLDLLNLGGVEVEELKQLKKKLDIDYIKEDIKSLLKETREGLERVKKIVLDLKNFSRVESDDHWQWSDIHAGLDSTLTIVWNELKYKCEVVKEYGELPRIWCEPSQLSQVFMNLLVNAAQAIEVRGRITIRTGSDGERVWVEISDTGSGIPANVLPRIFDPFFTTKPVGSGTGLGLPVSYGIVEKHHGKIEVESEVGKGTTFRVVLPVRQAQNEEKT